MTGKKSKAKTGVSSRELLLNAYERFQGIADTYGGLPEGAVIAAFTKATNNAVRCNPYIQNRRVKEISSLPVDYTKDKVVEMLRNVDGNEQPLREVAHGLEYTAYPLWHLRKVYQDLLTYHSYISPKYADKEDVSSEDFWREWKLLEKLKDALDISSFAHMAAGQAILEGKVFYYPRIDADKSHNKINHAFMQQLPSNWTKIVGFNNKSKYTLAFNLFYFLQPGTDPLQFGDLFLPYLDDFYSVIETAPKGVGKTVVYASRGAVNMDRFNALKGGGKLAQVPDVYYQGGRWFYWVTLPADKVYTFEIDDVNRNAVSPFTGLFISMLQIAQYEQIQLELVQNPLISLLTGEIPYRDDPSAPYDDVYKLSNAGRQLFETLWYQMLAANNTSGIGIYMAPLENMSMHQLSEAPSATQISANGYSYAMAKAGMSGIVPTEASPRAGLANISLHIESRFAARIYADVSRMMENIFDGLNLKYKWKFTMFGSLAHDKECEESARKGMTLGILADTLVYFALRDQSIFDDMSISRAIEKSGILDLRLPLVSSYSAKNEDGKLPPGQSDGGRDAAKELAAHEINPGGRQRSESAGSSEGHENDADSYGNK